MLKQDLKVQSEKLKTRNTIQERRYINRMFRVAPKIVYRMMKGENNGPVKDMPEKEKIKGSWGGSWSSATHYKQDVPWLHTLHNEYATDAQQKEYEITDEILEKVLSKMANDKPGKDLNTCIWIKSLRSTRQYLKGCLKNVITHKIEIPDWLITTKTILIAKNKETKNEQNYRLIAIQNSMYKIYTSILAKFITDHCTENNLITEEQAAGERGSWGCTDQLLIDKEVTGTDIIL